MLFKKIFIAFKLKMYSKKLTELNAQIVNKNNKINELNEKIKNLNKTENNINTNIINNKEENNKAIIINKNTLENLEKEKNKKSKEKSDKNIFYSILIFKYFNLFNIVG